MKFIFLIFFSLLSFDLFAGNCTSTTRNNYTIGQVLRSADLNADLNQLVAKLNSLDGGCLTDGTLEASALNSTDFATVTNRIQQGCPLIFVNANTVGVGRCIASVNGSFVKTTSQTNVTWGCTSCSAEANSTIYYIYARSGSVGSVLNLLISTTAPNADGYDSLGNKILGKFYNNASGDIDSSSIYSWGVNRFTTLLTSDATAPETSFSFIFGGANAGVVCSALGNCATMISPGGHVLRIERTSVGGNYIIYFKRKYTYIFCQGNLAVASSPFAQISLDFSTGINTDQLSIITLQISNGAQSDTRGLISCWGY